VRIAEALAEAARQIDRRDAEVLLCALLQCNRAALISRSEHEMAGEQAQRFSRWVRARAAGQPVAYLIGTREFYGREFRVGPEVLIPRPETEHIAEQALARLSGQKWLESSAGASVLDLGTGSGAIAITLALERPAWSVTATDVSGAALKMARENAEALKARVEFIESDWYAALGDRRFDLVVSNPPYVAARDPHLARGDLRFEPAGALTDGSTDGLDSIRRIVAGARQHLNVGGWLLFEHGYDQADAARALLSEAGFTDLIRESDLAGISRVAGGQVS
jgi:release factor glutamine methyltransferase